MPHDWRSATLTQAKSDYDMFLRLWKDEDVHICHALHYLQMTTEKLAKAFLTRSNERYPKTHNAFKKFVNDVKAVPEFRSACGFTRSDQFKEYINSISPLVQAIEDLSPEGDDHINPEYPWETNVGIIVPAEYPFENFSFQKPQMIKLLKFIEISFRLA